jgi:hypothetical protein
MIKLLLIVLGIILCLLACTHPAEETASPLSTEMVEMESPVIIPLPEPNEIPKTEEILEPEVPVAEPAMVEWIDFVKYNGLTYKGDWSKTTVPLENIGELLGSVENSVPSEIWNFSEYTVPDNASPYRSVGTSFYAVKDNENAIAVYDKTNDTYYLYKIRK